MTTEYEKVLSPTEITALARRNHIVKDVLDSFDLAEESSISPWQLMVIVSELVKYCERVMIERYDQYLSGTDNQTTDKGVLELKTHVIEKVLKQNDILLDVIKEYTNDGRTDWGKVHLALIIRMDDRIKDLGGVLRDVHSMISDVVIHGEFPEKESL